MTSRQYWAVVPAAGIGKRMGSSLPKQYLTLLGVPVLQHTLQALLKHPDISGVVVALAENDQWFPDIHDALPSALSKRVHTVEGGEERFHSVMNGLCWVRDTLGFAENLEPWVLVHDAARPCIAHDDISRLITSTLDVNRAGAILATPVRDTMKRGDGDGRIKNSVDREDLWHALTPQLFPVEFLFSAMQAVTDVTKITDEASAMELVGYQPKLVEGGFTNLKITHPDDLALAEFYLSREER